MQRLFVAACRWAFSKKNVVAARDLSIHRGALGTLIMASLLASSAAAAASQPADGCVWSAHADRIEQIRVSDHMVTATIPLNNPAATVMNGTNCGLVAITDKRLLRFDSAAAALVDRPLRAISDKLANPHLLASDPADDSIWLAESKTIFHVAADGTLLGEFDAPGVVRSVMVSLDRSLWVLGSQSLWHLSPAGSVLATHALARWSTAIPTHFAFDYLHANLWLAGEKHLALVNLSVPESPVRHFSLEQVTKGIALDPLSGALWLVSADRLLSFGPDGTTVTDLDLRADRPDRAAGLSFDPLTRSLWIVSTTGITHYVPGKGIVHRFTEQHTPLAVAAPAFLLNPVLRLDRPQAGGVSNNASPLIRYVYDYRCNGRACAVAPGAAGAAFTLAATLNQQTIGPFVYDMATGQASFTPPSPLPDGLHSISAQARSRFGQFSNVAVDRFTIDTKGPEFSAMTPANGTTVSSEYVMLRGRVDDPHAFVVLDGFPIEAQKQVVAGALEFSIPVTLTLGDNHLVLTAVDQAGNVTAHKLTLRFVPPPPAPPLAASVALGKLSAGIVSVSGIAGALAPMTQVRVTNSRTQHITPAQADATGAFSLSLAANVGDILSVRTVDAWGVSSSAIELVVKDGSTVPVDPDSTVGIVPPDPTQLASRIDPSVPTRIDLSTAFLYSGSNAIQTGVASGTIERRRVAVIHGKVSSRDGSPLPAVRVRVQGHPEFGQTYSRADGRFDLVVNGGAVLTLTYDKTGLLPAQRQVRTPWRDYVTAPEVALVALDDKVTQVDLSSNQMLQVVQGNPVTDDNGVRQATLFFQPGTSASMQLKDGSTLPLSKLSVRATEYTVGPRGSVAMPGPLPATSGYTYAVEFSVDEAISAGARMVSFSRPVFSYVDNFLNFPVGETVPSGFYDRDKSAWVPAANGRIIRVLSVSNGVAAVDLDGTGREADGPARAALGITEEELRELGIRYVAGKSLWRVPVMHFTPYDFNWPFGPPQDAAPPTGCDAAGKCVENEPEEDEPCEECGSVIQVENQKLGESVALTGTPFRLHYSSRKILRKLRIPLTAGSVPASLQRIDLSVTFAGRELKRSFAPTSGQHYEFEWDGLDAYQRKVVGRIAVGVTINYVYLPQFYRARQGVVNSFAQTSDGTPMLVDRTRGELGLPKSFTVHMDGAAPSAGVGGWNLDAHYSYDPVGGRLLAGDGKTHSAQRLNATAAAGNMSYSQGIAVDEAGAIYNASIFGIRKITTDGAIQTVTSSFNPQSFARDQKGNFYVTSESFAASTLYKISPDGKATALIGDGYTIPATQQQDVRPRHLAIDRDGTIYFAQNSGIRGNFFVEKCYIKKLTQDGIVSIVAGTGSCYQATGDNGPASAASLTNTKAMALDSKGNLYVAALDVVRKISPDGTIRTIAGVLPYTGIECYGVGLPVDGLNARRTCLGTPTGLAVDRDDNLIISSYDFYDNNKRRSLIRRMNSDATMETLALTNPTCAVASATALTAVGRAQAICSSDAFGATTVNANNEIVVALGDNMMIIGSNEMRCTGTNGQFALDCKGTLTADGDKVFPSSDGKKLLLFDQAGRHYRTIDGYTRALVHEFWYDEEGRLLRINDANQNVTTVARNANGTVEAIISPFKQQTRLGLDANGFIETITNPNNETFRMLTTKQGLLERFETPRKKASSFEYDEEGRLTRDQNAAGGFWTLARSSPAKSTVDIKVTSAMGRFDVYRTQDIPGVGKRRSTTADDGSHESSVVGDNGTTTATSKSGTVTTTVMGPDPRFGMQAPIVTSLSIKLPSGLTMSKTASRTVTLNSPNDPLSLLGEVNITSINGKPYKSDYNILEGLLTLTSPMNRKTVVKADAQNRPVMAMRAGVHPITYTYDARGQLERVSQGTGNDVRSLQYDYDAAGLVASVTDTRTGKTGYAYDKAGRVTAVTLPDTNVVNISYDENGNMKSVTPPGRPTHALAYSDVDALAGYLPPLLSGQQMNTVYEHNLDNQMSRIVRPDGNVIEFGYDSFGRVKSATSSTGVVYYEYHADTGVLNGIAAPGDIRLKYTYDGDFLTGTQMSGAVAGSVTTSYDNFFRVNKIGVNASEIAFGYDGDDLLTSAGALVLVRDPANGQLKGSQLGKIVTTKAYDLFGDFAGMSAWFNAALLYDEQHIAGTGGRLQGKTVVKDGVQVTYVYGYDANGRLTDVSENGAAVGHYTFDANGNRSSANGVAAVYDDHDRLTELGSIKYDYSANGELKKISDGNDVTEFDYDSTGNLRGVTLPGGKAISYLIDGQDRRVGKKINGLLTKGFLYQDDLQPAAELDGQGNVVSRFVYAGRANVPEYMIRAGVTYRIISDRLGSVQMVVDAASGAIAQRIDYDEWGNVLADTNPGFQPFGFAGGLYDQDTGLVRFGARDYDPKTARWTAKDPIGFAGGDTNLYGYVGASPQQLTDPSGLAAQPPTPPNSQLPPPATTPQGIPTTQVPDRPKLAPKKGGGMGCKAMLNGCTKIASKCPIPVLKLAAVAGCFAAFFVCEAAMDQ